MLNNEVSLLCNFSLHYNTLLSPRGESDRSKRNYQQMDELSATCLDPDATDIQRKRQYKNWLHLGVCRKIPTK